MGTGAKTENGAFTTTLQSIACGGTGGDLVCADTKDGKLVRLRPLHLEQSYTKEELAPSSWEWDIDGKKFSAPYKAMPNYFALAYKNRVYSKNRVKYPLKRVDWNPDGERNTQNRGISKFERISWDEAIDLVEMELRRVIDTYGPYSVICIGEDGHRESKDLHAGGGMHANLMSKLGGYTRETRTPDSVEGWYWGAKHVWGSGANHGLGLIAPANNGGNAWNVMKDISEHSELICFDAGDWELTQNYASQCLSALLKYWEELGKEFVVVDPFCNYTAVCHESMKWIPILPNTDAAFDFGVMHVWITEGTYDKEYVETHTVYFDKLVDYVMGKEDGVEKTPAWAAERCGVPEWTIKAYARNVASKVTSHAHYSSGAIKTPYSHEPGRTGAYKLAMQGLGKPGVQQCHLSSMVFAREEICRSTTAPFSSINQCRMFYPMPQTLPRTKITDAINNGSVKWWGSPCIVYVENSEQFIEYNYPADPQAGLAMLQAMAQRMGGEAPTEAPKIDRIHLLWSEKPCNMNCWNGGFEFQDAIRSPQVECFITNHQWLENDSLFADLILPVTTCVEDNDSMGGGAPDMRRFQALTPAAIDHVGESYSDFEIACMIGERFGVREQIDLGMTEDEWMKYGFEQSRMTEELTWDEFQKRGYYFPKMAQGWEDDVPGMRGFYEDPENNPLDTPTGKIEFWSQALADNFPDDKERQPMAKWIVGGPKSEGWTHDETFWGERCKDYTLLVTANPAKWRVHVQGDDIKWFREIETCKVKAKDGYFYEPIWMAPEDAKARGIEDGDIVKLFNERGTILFGARISERVTPRSVVVAKGSRVDPITSHLDRGGAINLICPNETVSKHCAGFAVTGYLAEAAKVTDEEYEGWKRDYPEAFARDYDPEIGINYKSWVVE